ncbi:MAG TPA: hypothetical protein VGQ62_02910 [Chloroflexota bacterium]|jgi:hypothetical protein|nr:hypothetical protein [Chloroflexota bacterium]
MLSNRGWSYSSSSSKRQGRAAYRRRTRADLLRTGLTQVLPVALTLAIVGGVSWYHFLFSGFTIQGAVVDQGTSQALAGAYVWVNASGTATDADGHFKLEGVKPPELVQAVAAGHRPVGTRQLDPSASLVVALEADSAALAAAAATRVAVEAATPAATEAPQVAFVPLPTPTAVPDPRRPLLPEHRIVAYYGNPLAKQMGILGELQSADMLKKLEQQAALYQAADRTRTVIAALELVTPAAQGDPGEDGTYRARMKPELIEQVASWAESNHGLLILDVQIGRSTVAEEVNVLLPYLRRPYVHLALDPEFAMLPGKVPGQVVGTMDASAINGAIQTLADVVRQENLPPKLLVVHRFTESMVTNAAEIRPDPNVQVIVTMDGFGGPELKLAQYNEYVHNQRVQFAGIKLFYHHDVPLLSPNDVVDLDPFPDLVIYQ